MAKKRIHQIAKELDIASADILFHAKELGIEVKTASSGLTEEEEQLVKLSLFPESESESFATFQDGLGPGRRPRQRLVDGEGRARQRRSASRRRAELHGARQGPAQAACRG